jgi:hypothetical protein
MLIDSIDLLTAPSRRRGEAKETIPGWCPNQCHQRTWKSLENPSEVHPVKAGIACGRGNTIVPIIYIYIY